MEHLVNITMNNCKITMNTSTMQTAETAELTVEPIREGSFEALDNQIVISDLRDEVKSLAKSLSEANDTIVEYRIKESSGLFTSAEEEKMNVFIDSLNLDIADLTKALKARDESFNESVAKNVSLTNDISNLKLAKDSLTVRVQEQTKANDILTNENEILAKKLEEVTALLENSTKVVNINVSKVVEVASEEPKEAKVEAEVAEEVQEAKTAPIEQSTVAQEAINAEDEIKVEEIKTTPVTTRKPKMTRKRIAIMAIAKFGDEYSAKRKELFPKGVNRYTTAQLEEGLKALIMEREALNELEAMVGNNPFNKDGGDTISTLGVTSEESKSEPTPKHYAIVSKGVLNKGTCEEYDSSNIDALWNGERYIKVSDHETYNDKTKAFYDMYASKGKDSPFVTYLPLAIRHIGRNGVRQAIAPEKDFMKLDSKARDLAILAIGKLLGEKLD